MPPPTDSEGGAGGSPLPPLRPLLCYDDPWTQLRTRDVNLDAFLKPDGDVLTLGGVRDVAQQRSVACVRAGTAAVPPPTETARRALAHYLASLDLVVERGGGVLASADDDGSCGGGPAAATTTAGAAAVAAAAGAAAPLPRRPFETEWTSPLGGRAARFIALRGAAKEQAMALFLYGSLLRQLGHQALDDALAAPPAPDEGGAEAGGAGAGVGRGRSGAGAAGGTGGGSDAHQQPPPAGPLAEAALHLRRGAGVFRRLANRTLPAIFLALGTRDRPLEITPPAADAMALCCLAEAQALTAFRAEERGSPPALLSALHEGSRSLYARASRAVAAGTGGGSGGGGGEEHAQPGERLTRFLALGQAVSSARALRAAALDLASRFEAGAAERCCDEAARELSTAARGAAGGDAAWKLLVAEEARRLELVAAPIRKDRLFVTVQAVPRDLPPLPEGKVLVAELPFNEPFVAGGVVDAR